MFSGYFLIALAYFYLAWCMVNAAIAEQKNRSFTGVGLSSILFTPFIVWLYIATVPSKPLADHDV